VTAFLRKEFKEIYRTYRLWAIPVIFLFMAFSAPASAKFLPDFLKTQMEAQNITIKLPDPTAVQSFQAYFKNLTQIGLLAVILLSMGLTAEEKSQGILAQVVTKPVRRPDIIWAKWLVHGGWYLLSMAIGAVGCYLYTLGLFGKADLGGFMLANGVFALYLVLIFSVTVAAGAAARTQGVAGGLGLAGFVIFSTLPVFGGGLQHYSPGALSDLAFKLASGSGHISDAFWPTIVTVAAIVLLLIGGISIFDRQEL